MSEVDDKTPSIIIQSQEQGWNAQYYDFGKAEGDGNAYFNPSIVQRDDGYWLLVRRSEPHPYGLEFGQNDVWAFMMDEEGKVPKMGKRLKWKADDPSQHFEDPRGFFHPRINQTVIGACTFIWYRYKRWTGPHQCMGTFDHDWSCRRMYYPKIGGNPGEMVQIDDRNNYEKNWLWFLHDEQLTLLYKAHPWMVYQFGENWDNSEVFRNHDGASWSWGDIRGGTPPIRVGDYYFTFHHSSLHWRDRFRRYYAGCLAFEAKPPFYPKLITKDPILIGSQNDTWTPNKPLVVFPCGAVFRNDKWMISMGVNDLRAAWLELPHKDVLARLRPIQEATSIFVSDAPKTLGDGLNGGNIGSDVTPNLPPPPRPKKRKRKYKISPQGLENLRRAAANAREHRKKILASE